MDPFWAWLLKPIVPHVSGMWDLKDVCQDRGLRGVVAFSGVRTSCIVRYL